MRRVYWGLAFLMLSAAGLGAQTVAATVAVGTQPFAVAVNPVTNQIYVVNYGGNSVTVIDGATNTTTTLAVGSNPVGVAVNPITNQIYVTNYYSSSVTVINGATNTVITTVSVGLNPNGVAV